MNIGVIVPYLGATQTAFVTIKQVNKLLANGYKDDVVIFYEDLMTPCVQPKCSTLSINEVLAFDGLLITTDISTTQLATNIVNKGKKIYYIWDLEWRNWRHPYLETVRMLQNKKLGVVSRSESHANALKCYSNRTADLVCDQFPLREIIDFYEKDF